VALLVACPQCLRQSMAGGLINWANIIYKGALVPVYRGRLDEVPKFSQSDQLRLASRAKFKKDWWFYLPEIIGSVVN